PTHAHVTRQHSAQSTRQRTSRSQHTAQHTAQGVGVGAARSPHRTPQHHTPHTPYPHTPPERSGAEREDISWLVSVELCGGVPYHASRRSPVFLPEVAAIVPVSRAKRHPRFIRARVFHLVLGRQGRQLEGVVWFPPRLVIEDELIVVEV